MAAHIAERRRAPTRCTVLRMSACMNINVCQKWDGRLDKCKQKAYNFESGKLILKKRGKI